MSGCATSSTARRWPASSSAPGSALPSTSPTMRGDVAAGADPDAVALGDVIEELDEPGDPSRAPDQPVVQGERHQLGPVSALGVERLEAIDHVAGEIIAGRKPVILVKAVVVG